MAYRYPEDNPKWIQATQVEAATANSSHVNVIGKFDVNIYELTMCKVGNHNRWGDQTKSEVTIETKEHGWLRFWFNNADIQPFQG